MPRIQNPATGDVNDVHADLVGYFLSQGWVPVITEDEAAELKGAALDEALTESGLPTTGKADEKRARLADSTTPKEN